METHSTFNVTLKNKDIIDKSINYCEKIIY